MPIKPQDKARILAEAGVDPRKYWMDDNGEIIDMPEQGTAETAIKTTLHNAPRTALGFVGSALGAAGAGALATPETAGLATIPAALAGGAAGGAAGGFAGQKLQEAVYPESWRLAEEARSVRAPLTTKVADIGASMMLMRPSPAVFRAAARAPGEFLRTAGQLQPKTVEALANIGLGAGMSGGMAAAQGASPGDIALETALGALQVQPTWLGTKLSGGLFQPFNAQGLAQPGGLPTTEAQARFAGALEAQNAPPQPTIAPEALAELVTKFAKQQAADAKRIQEGVIAGEGARQNEVQRQKRAVVDAVMGVQSEDGKTVLPADIRSVDERLEATGGAPEQQMKLTPAVKQAEEARLRGASPVEQELAMLLSPEQHKYFRDVFAKYGTEYRDVPELAASGRFVPRKSAAEPSRTDISSRAYLDVYPHEALHALLSDTLNYGTARERAFAERALRELGIDVLTDANGRKSLAEGSEEALAKQVGEESVRVLAGKQKPAPMREAFSDFVDYLINDKLTPDVARRILRDRTVFGAGTRGIVARAAQRGGTRAAAGAPPVMSEAPEQKPAAQAPAEKPFEPVELPERLAPTRDMTPEQIAQVEAASEAARTPPPAAEAEAVQAQRRADELAARAEQMKTLLDEQEARLRRLENAERIRQRIGALPESPLKAPRAEARRISNLNEFEQQRPALREEEGSGAMTQEELDQAAAQRSSDAVRSMREAADRGERIGPGTDVTRPETVEYTGAPVPANVRAGVRRREAMLETPADLEARRIEEQLSGRDRGRDRYQPLAEDRPIFATQFQKELDSPNPLGAMPGKDGRIPANNLRTGLARLNNLERELLTNAGLEQFLRNTPRPTAEELKKWADEKLPKIEIRPQMALGEASKSAQARANLLHELESYGIRPQFPDRVSDGRWFYNGELMHRWGLPVYVQEQVDALVMHDLEGAGNLVYDSATARFTTVNPRELADMPGAVDILVKMPGSGQKIAAEAGHYPKEGKDLVTHVRAYEHTLPDGTKALRVFELQSDWGQERRKLEAKWPVIESLDKLPDGWRVEDNRNGIQLQNAEGKHRAWSKTLDTLLTIYNDNRTRELKIIPDNPILSQTDSLGLKAAVEYARERGISKLIIDDAETAMLTEGHDHSAERITSLIDHDQPSLTDHDQLMYKITGNFDGPDSESKMRELYGSDWRDGKFVGTEDILSNLSFYRIDKPELNLNYANSRNRQAKAKELQALVARGEHYYIPQLKGMTRAYNDILPQLMRKMTGDKGVRVNMGEHKNALHVGPRDVVGRMPWQAENNIHGETRMFNSREEAQAFVNSRRNPFDWNIVENPEIQAIGKPRKDLFFKNPDGSPKTESTGIMYDLGVPQARRAAGEPFTVSNERYQPLAEDRESLQPDEELQSGAQIRRVLELLRNNQDRGNTTEVAGRELVQNSVDAIYKNAGGSGTVWSSTKSLPNDESQVNMLDNAGGMSPQFMLTKYISMGYSTKMVGEAGGFGVAKGQFLGKALEFRVNSQYTDKNGDTYLTQLVGTGDGFMAMQEPRKFKYPIGEWVEPVDGFKYRIDKINKPKTDDGTLVSARYAKNKSSSWEARSIIDESLSYHKNIKAGYLPDNVIDSDTNKGTVLEGTLFYPSYASSEKPEYNTLGDIKTANADIAVFVKTDGKPAPSKLILYRVLSNGISQFGGYVSVKNEMLMPELIFNVKPIVSGSSESYPFTPDRSSLKVPEAKAIEDYIRTFEQAERKRRLDKYGSATQDAPKLQQAGLEDLSILDVTEKLPPEFVRDVQTNPTFGVAARAIRDINTVVNDVLTRRFPKENYKRGSLKGFFVGTSDAYGVRFGSKDPFSKGDIYYDPTLLFDKAIADTEEQGGDPNNVDDVMSRWLGQTIGVALHENLHQKVHTEGEELSRELTFTAGELAMAGELVFAKLGKTIDSIIGNAELYNTLKDYNEKAKVYRSSQKGNEFISGVKGTIRSSGERYQPLGPERGEYKGAKLPERERRVFGRGIFAGNLEALRRTGDPQKIEFAGAMEELYARIRNYTGQYEEGIIRPLTDLSKTSQQKVVEALYDESMTRQPATAGLSPDELGAHREIRAGLLKMRNDQIAANHLIEGKPAGRDPFYFPHVVDSSIIHDLSNSPESPRAKEAERQFIDFNAELFRNNGVAPADAQRRATEAFGKFIGSLKPISVDSGFDYGAVSMPAGTKLPPTWVAADPVDGFRSYIKRFSRARAFYDVIGRDESAMRQIGRKFYYDAAGKEAAVMNPGSRLQRDPNVRALLENALGITHESQEGITPAIGRLANSLLLGNVATRLTDAATTPFKALAYLPPRYIPGLLTNMRNLRSSIDNAYKTGGVRRGDMMVVREVLGAGDRYVKGMDKVAETITKYTGSEALEKGARFLAQNIGEYIYDVNKTLADRGDKRATDFLNRVTPKWRTLAREETAQRIARLFQGNYDATNLPIWIANSPAAPFFSMMKWNIEQWNNFKRFAWEPALKGDPYALMATVLGGVAGGIAVGELREKITGKKQRVATAGELNFGFREGDKARASMEAMRKAAFLAQVTGTFGIVGELSLQAIDVAVKDKPQGFSWPAYEFVSNVIGKIANAVPAAIERPEDALLITGTAANDLAKDIVAQYRILWNAVDRTKGAGEVEEANRRRDLRMSEKLRGEPTRFSPFIERDYRNERERQFDKERDRQRAVAIARQLDARARRESATGAEYKEARRKFRTSRIVGIPSRENNPEQFYRHIQFVRNTQGAEAADQLARDYVMLRTEQKLKSSMFR